MAVDLRLVLLSQSFRPNYPPAISRTDSAADREWISPRILPLDAAARLHTALTKSNRRRERVWRIRSGGFQLRVIVSFRLSVCLSLTASMFALLYALQPTCFRPGMC